MVKKSYQNCLQKSNTLKACIWDLECHGANDEKKKKKNTKSLSDSSIKWMRKTVKSERKMKNKQTAIFLAGEVVSQHNTKASSKKEIN